MITDIDKGSDDRRSPLPNTHDQLNFSSVSSKGTNSTNYTTPSTNLSNIAAAKNGQFTIVQVGSFATTATFTTTAPGTGNYIGENFSIYQAPHNLTFTPGLLAYEISSLNQYSPMPLTKFQASSSTQALWYSFYIFVDTTNVYITLNTMTSGSSTFTFQPGFTFKWYLLQQTSN